MNDTKNNLKKQIKYIYNPNCTKFSRCNNHKTCKTCNTNWRKKEFSKATKHLNENIIKGFKYKHYLVITSNDLKISTYEKNSNVDLFMKEFIIKKRNKNFFISKDTQYFITKEISYNKKYDDYNPHYNIILLSNKKLDFNNKQLLDLQSSFGIDLYQENIYKSNNSFLSSIEKIINYSLKFDESRATLEKHINISKFKRDIFKTDLFNNDKYQELHKRLYIHIQEAKAHYNDKIKQAKKIFKRNINKKSPKNYIRLLKSMNKKIKYLKGVRNRAVKRIKKRKLSYF